jgi:hypothetical protein
MARLLRIVAVNVPHNVAQRGDARQFILSGDAERSLAKKWKRPVCPRFSSIPFLLDNGSKGNGIANDEQVYANCRSLIEGPVIISFSLSATGAIGAQVQIVGYNFGKNQNNSVVTFTGANNSTITATVTTWTDTLLTTTVPAGAVTGPVVVTANGKITKNQVVASNGLAFTVSQ